MHPSANRSAVNFCIYNNFCQVVQSVIRERETSVMTGLVVVVQPQETLLSVVAEGPCH